MISNSEEVIISKKPAPKVHIIPWNSICYIHNHIYMISNDELIVINMIDGEGNLTTKNHLNYKYKRDYIKVLRG